MKFIRTEDLKIGMRLARPIYSKKGVLLFDRDSRLSSQSIDSVKNFGLLGIYILEPAEPLPPISAEDREFEHFQTRMVFLIQEELENILRTKKTQRVQMISDQIIKNYGHQDGKINFYQNLRSKDDYVFCHTLNVTILCTMIAHMLNMRHEEEQQTVFAALVHDIGKIGLEGDLVFSSELDDRQQDRLQMAQLGVGDLITDAFAGDGTAIKRICGQALAAQMDANRGKAVYGNMKMVRGARILMVANRYDELTGMTLDGTSKSEVKAIREFYDKPEFYDPEIVEALVGSINILFPGVSVELNTGEKALVLVENAQNILRPTVLSFRDNSIIDLSLKVNEDLEVVDIMKTLDNRCIMDTATLRQAGFAVKETES